MTDRWTQAEQRFRQREEDRRYRRDDQAWAAREKPVQPPQPPPQAPQPQRRGRHSMPTSEPEDEWGEFVEETTVIPPQGGGRGFADPHRGDPGYDRAGYAEDPYPSVDYPTPGYPDRGYPQHGYPDDGYTYADGEYAAEIDDRAAAGYAPYPPGGYAPEGFAADPHAPAGYVEDDFADGEYIDDGYQDDYVDEHAPAPPRRPSRAEPPAGRGRGGSQRSAAAQRARPTRAKRSRAASRKAAERKRRRRNFWVVIAVVVIVVGGGALYGTKKLIDSFRGPEDFAGPAGPVVVVQVEPGDTSQEIATAMVDRGIVKSTGAFVQAAVRNSNMNSVQPGYYAIPTQSPAVEAVTALTQPQSRVGNLVISEGRQLHDQQDVNTGSRKEGIYRKIADASCVGEAAQRKCVTYEQLDAAGATPDLAALGVPTWAQDAVRNVPDHSRQLEGLIAAGTWDFDPSASAMDILKELVTTSVAQYESTGMQPSGAQTKLSPYEALIAASLVEREALPQDMTKVARVIMNRLDVDQPLQLDSTVNYALDRTEVATTDADRDEVTPWNTYAKAGLPATPIASPSLNALRAIENPEAGPWLYFVTIDKKGTTLFTDDYQEHLRNIEKAQESGILDSGR